MYTAEFNDGINATNAQDFDTFEEARDWCEENITAEADEVLSDANFWYGEWTTFAGETIELWASIEFWEDEDDAPTQDAINEYLYELRDSGVNNMLDAGSFVAAEFHISEKEARIAIVAWMRSFSAAS